MLLWFKWQLNTCVLAYLLYKLMLMPLINTKSEPLCVYLHTAYCRPSKGKDIRILAGGWLSNPGVQSCRHLPVSPHRHTHCLCNPHTACWLTQLYAGGPATCSDTVSPKASLGMATFGGRSLSDGGITPDMQLSVYIPCC